MTKGKKAIAGVIAFLATVGIVSNLTGGTATPVIPSTDNTNVSESAAKPVETNVLPAQEVKTEPEPTPAPTPAPAEGPTAPATNLSNDDYYTNSAEIPCTHPPTAQMAASPQMHPPAVPMGRIALANHGEELARIMAGLRSGFSHFCAVSPLPVTQNQ